MTSLERKGKKRKKKVEGIKIVGENIKKEKKEVKR